ncbi:SusC/RagA family TonB-linked outer membrane protein [Parabacteroides sp. FAFU027]|uniref:SusC/RagA family TonB-linked outer membrane protein n=1 Tax=Parabacteroides sp. FAFU027 TaxID=2922715 RepID=UPI001FAF492E|nr:TonB-dependent receptor [Parabacteroides sp. FAFU027]
MDVRKKILSVLALSVCTSMPTLWANQNGTAANTATVQQKKGTITGKVKDTHGETLIGVSIKIKGTTLGTITDYNGNFSLSNVPANAVLVFSYVGMENQEVAVGSKTALSITLQDKSAGLNEVVVVGYGTQKRSDITGSVTSVPKDRFNQVPVTNVMQAIQGSAAGVNVSQTSSVPGRETTIQVRGANSINASTSPFIVVDGIPFYGSTNDINPADIESMEILKDASAVAIYGTRGSAGVILITTKKGKSGAPIIRYNGYGGVENIAHEFTPRSAAEYYQKYQDYKTQKAGATGDLMYYGEAANYQKWVNGQFTPTDWLKEATQQGNIQDHNISINGGTQEARYYVSGDLLDQKGVIKGYDYKRFSLRTNLDINLKEWLTVGTNLSFVNNDYSNGSDKVNLLYACAMSPFTVPTDGSGNYITYPNYPETLYLNPMLNLNADLSNVTKNLTGTVYAELTPFKGLKYRVNASQSYIINNSRSYYGVLAGNTQGGSASASSSEKKFWVVENILSYTKDIQKHHFDVTALYSAQKTSYFKDGSNAVGFINDGLSYYNMAAGTTQTAISSAAYDYTLLSQMGRFNYSYDSRYLFSATARRDGSSVFGANTSKYGVFPSFALGWNINNEAFMKQYTFLNNLKLRFSYGTTGNEAIGINQTETTSGSGKIPYNGTGVIGTYANILGNANLNWESTSSKNIGLDFGFLNNRIFGTIEAYQNNTYDLLMKRNIPNITGYANVYDNLGKIENKGLEITINTKNLKIDKFSWETSLNFATNKNKIVDLYGDGKDDIGNKWFIGKPIGVIYDYEKIGIWQASEIAATDKVNKAGDVKFKDQLIVDSDGDGIPDKGDGIIDSKDKVILGQTAPKWRGGITNTFHYGDFHLSVFIETVQGSMKSASSEIFFGDEAGRRNTPKEVGYWTAQNQDNYWPSLVYANTLGYSFPLKNNYTRIKDVTLSYTVPQTLLKKAGISAATVYLSGRNLYTFTNWIGWDPEANQAPRGSGDWTNDYPTTRTFTVGLNITL